MQLRRTWCIRAAAAAAATHDSKVTAAFELQVSQTNGHVGSWIADNLSSNDEHTQSCTKFESRQVSGNRRKCK